jgi:putative hemolysin
VLLIGNVQAIDIMTPMGKVLAVPSEEILGPIVLSELHRSRHSHFPVYENDLDNIVGTIAITGLSSPKISIRADEAMNSTVYYIHEEQTLPEVLQVMIKTNQDLFIVINSLGAYLGIITAREVLKCLVGKVITDEFDRYDQRDIVANMFNITKEDEEKEEKLSEDETEVVE